METAKTRSNTPINIIIYNYPNLAFPFERLGKDYELFPEKWKEYEVNGNIKLFNKNRYLTHQYKISDIVGYDTETYRGNCRLLCSNNDKLYIPDIPKNHRFEKCLEFLMREADNLKWHLFWNIDFDISAILKLWNNIPAIKKLSRGIEVIYDDYKLSWLKGRMFTIKKGHRTIRFTDLNNLFKTRLEEASLTYLKNESKDNIDGNKLNNSLKYWNDNKEAIIKYCIQDCNLVKKLGVLLLINLVKAKVEIPRYIVSPASLSKQDFRYHCKLPNIASVPTNILDIAYKTYFGGRFELVKRGVISKAFLYDINSQYPTYIKDLPSLKLGLWKTVNILPKDECIGYFKAKVHIPDDNYLSTIPIKHNGVVKFCNGYFDKWFTWYDLDLMRDYVIKIEKGYIYEKAENEYYPFRERILFHFSKKALWKNKNELMYQIHKLTMNALYGCFIEIHQNELDDGSIENSAGILFNSVYASQITAFGRWSVVKDVWNERKHIIAIHTDSVIMDKEVKLKCSKELGDWSFEASGKTYMINTGMYQINGKKRIIKTRGVPKKDIGNWFLFAYKNGNVDSKEFKIKRMLKISQSLVQYKNLIGVNTMIDNIKSVNLNSDTKRCWNRDFIDFNDSLLHSINSLPYIAVLDDDVLDIYPNPLI